MKMDVVAGSQNDEFYTPPRAIYPIMRYIKNESVLWCPFDTEESHFVKLFRKRGNKVIATHITTGDDFFNMDVPEEIDVIVSNPPYSLKNKVFQKLFSIGKPFAMLVGVVGLFESQLRFNLFKENKFEILYMNKRISYFKNLEDQKPSVNPPFSSVYVTKSLLPHQIVFEELHP